MGKLKYKGYTGSVEYSPEDECLFGKVLGLRKGVFISYEGNSVEELKKDFEGGIDDYLATCEKNGVEPARPYSGKLVVRLSPDLHGSIAEYVAEKGTTINAFLNEAAINELKAAHAL